MATQENKFWTANVSSIQEDEILLTLVKTHGTKKWALISRVLKDHYRISDKSGKQCRERWINALNPKLSTSPWTAEEEKLLFEIQEKFGNKWSTISSFLKGRSDNATKNHFYSIVRKNIRRHNKHNPGQQIKGNIQELLSKPELRKILVKKPRHYYKRTEKKEKTEKTVQNFSKPSKKRRQSDIKETFSKSGSINSRNASTAVSSEIKTPNFVCPTPVHQVFIGDSALTPVNRGLNSFFTSSILLDEVLDVSPLNETKNFCFRSYGRNLSLKSIDEEFVDRGMSRRSTGKSEVIRGDSRKNSQKEWERTESKKNSLKEWKRNESRHNSLYENMRFPVYSPKWGFDYRETEE